MPATVFTPMSSELVPRVASGCLRTDNEIVAYLMSSRPVTGPKNIWTFWDKGWDAMRPWVQRCVIAWARRLDREWEIRVLDAVPGSPHHVSRFIPADLLPNTFGQMQGRHAGQHMADLIRLPLLFLHGGVWLDAGLFLLRDPEEFCWLDIIDPTSPAEVYAVTPGIDGRPISNGFLASLPGNRFLQLWHAVFLELWQDRITSRGIGEHPLVSHLGDFVLPPVFKVFEKILTSAGLKDYLCQWEAAARVLSLIDAARAWDGPAYLARHVRLLGLDHFFLHNMLTDFAGDRQFALLRTPRASAGDPEHAAAKQFVDTLLVRAALVKLSQGFMPEPPQLATIWDREENRDADAMPGTWGEYLRWASVHLTSTRAVVPLNAEQMKVLAPKVVWVSGVFDPIGGEGKCITM